VRELDAFELPGCVVGCRRGDARCSTLAGDFVDLVCEVGGRIQTALSLVGMYRLQFWREMVGPDGTEEVVRDVRC